MPTPARYIPALGTAMLTRFYDPLMRLLREDELRGHLVDLMQIGAGHRVLDVGCGTATLALLIKKRYPDAIVEGIDGDPTILDTARSKAEAKGLRIELAHAMASELPYPDDAFDRVVSSLVFHHLTTSQKRGAAREIHRILRPGSTFFLADLGPPRTLVGKAVARIAEHLEEMGDNLRGRLPGFLEEAGFCEVSEIYRFQTLIGPIAVLRAKKPEA